MYSSLVVSLVFCLSKLFVTKTIASVVNDWMCIYIIGEIVSDEERL